MTAPTQTAPTHRERLEQAIERITAAGAQGPLTFLRVDAAAAILAADASDARAKAGTPLGPLDGAILSIKDCFDIAGQPTRAGASALDDAPSAVHDAPAIARLRKAGAVFIGRTNMSAFAFTGIGINPHHGTPGNPHDTARCPGGSSSGASVSVARDMADIGIGTDTGGSVRIPAAWCGLIGFKPTRARVPVAGVFPLSRSFDSIGPLAKSVAQCHAADAVLSGQAAPLSPRLVAGVRLGVAQGLPVQDLDPQVAAGFEAALRRLGLAGAILEDVQLPLQPMADVAAMGGIVPAEAGAVHRALMAKRGAEYDPIVRLRIEGGLKASAADYLDMLDLQAAGERAMDAALTGFDAVVMPTTPNLPPLIAELAEQQAFFAANGKALRNTFIGNFFGLTAISLPLPVAGLPVGFMLLARAGHDAALLNLAAGMERVLCRA